MTRATLVVMAAGIASRYGGNKQIEGMGPNGEILMEYSIHDAIRAGFTKVVFIIRREMLEQMKALCGDKLSERIEVCYAFQDFDSVPAFYRAPEARTKPLGTVHAVLCARKFIHEPFAVINADDYYGIESFAQMYGFLSGLHAPNRAAMMGYLLRNTVSRHGTVSRGLCRLEGEKLAGVRELKKIRLCEDGRIVSLDSEMPELLDPDALVSMNFWGFSDRIFDAMQRRFDAFLRALDPDDMSSECLLPVTVDQMIREGELEVDVLETKAIWFGVTYKEDRPAVAQALRNLHEQGYYAN